MVFRVIKAILLNLSGLFQFYTHITFNFMLMYGFNHTYRCFPEPFQSTLAVVVNALFGLSIKMKLCKPYTRKFDFGNPTTISLSVSSGDPVESERRKLVRSCLNTCTIKSVTFMLFALKEN